VKDSPAGPDGLAPWPAGPPPRLFLIAHQPLLLQNLTMGNRIPSHRPAGSGEPRKRRQTDERPTAHERGYGAVWRKLRLLVLREEPLCRHCGAAATDVDHVVPLAAGGTNDRGNLCPLCHGCHSRKTVQDRLRGYVRHD